MKESESWFMMAGPYMTKEVMESVLKKYPGTPKKVLKCFKENFPSDDCQYCSYEGFCQQLEEERKE